MRNLRKLLACAGLALALAATTSASLHAEVVLKRGNGAEPESLDPAISTGVPESFIQMDIFEGLVHPGPDGTLRPGVAESWEISDDGLTYTFKLRPDAVWSDGTPLTAGDFVYSWSRMVDPATASNYAFILWPITNAERITKGEVPKEQIGAQAVDDRTLKVTLRSPTPYFLQMLMHHSAYPVPKQAIEKFGREWTRPGNIVSNGAYMIQEWVPQGHIKAVKNPRFRDAAEVGIDTVFYYPVEEYGTELKQFRAGELHTTYDVPQEQIPMLEKDMAGQFRNSPYFGTYYYGINVTREPFKSNVRLRHALAMALDRDILVKQITKGGEIPAYGWVPPGVPGYEQQQVEWAGTDQKARVAEAKKILAEAGFDKGNPLKVELLYNTNDNHKKIAIAVAGMWKQFLGIETTLRNEEWKVYLESRNKKQFEVMRAAWIGDYVDPYSFLELLRGDIGEQNPAGYANPEYDATADKATAETDPAARFGLLAEAERMVLADMPIIPIYFYSQQHMVSDKVKGWQDNLMDWHPTRYLSLE
ncbi:peptide ABC transporter substrate-binding protein [Skermanella mucosa]|uniref:peptide ABC transporter substrate-binding protein n=1 Tax=Skermanella mucosa TaxID=1789672 RepID=UPI00192B0079|nr:peptide ABC transporter substrate-binding protein [Skermanella mucosa]UEM20136.1 peptide ABC transporter substrate-binding protein [Skermanella mucosa]